MRYVSRSSIWTLSPEMLGYTLGSGPGNGAWPAANDALFLPLNLSRPIHVKRLFALNGNVTGGNIDLGVYSADGGLITSIGSTAQSGASALQFFDITDVFISPGLYYVAVAKNDTTGTLRRQTTTVIRNQMYGMLKMASAFPLPAVATFATVTATYVPLIGLDLGGVL